MRADGVGGWEHLPTPHLTLIHFPTSRSTAALTVHEQLVGDENVKWHLCTAPRGGTGEPTGVGWGPRAGENLGSEC